MAVLLLPMVLRPNALAPLAVLYAPSVFSRSALRPQAGEGGREGWGRGRFKKGGERKESPAEAAGRARALISTHLLHIHSPCISHAWPQATPQERRGEERGGKREREGGEERRGKRREGRRKEARAAGAGCVRPEAAPARRRSHWMGAGSSC